MTKSLDADLDFKLRFKRILFLMEYYSPLEVMLSQYYEDSNGNRKRNDLTDLDVLGIRYDCVLNPHKIVCDCKTGRRVSDANRLFWLRGICDYFGADTGYFIQMKLDTHVRAIAPKLGLRVLDEKELSNLEKSLKADSLVLPISDYKFYEERQNLWGINIPKGTTPTKEQLEIKEVFTYLSYLYWYYEPHRNLLNLITRYQKVSHLLRNDNPRDVLLVYTGLERFAHCLLEMGSYIHARGLSDIRMNARIYLYGGINALREREDLFKLMNQAGLTRDNIDPPYLQEVLEVTNRMLRNPHAASKVLSYLEAIYGWCVQLGNNSLEPVFNGNIETGAIVLARDMCISFCVATGLRENLFSALLAL